MADDVGPDGHRLRRLTAPNALVYPPTMATDPHSNPLHAPPSEEPALLRYSMDADETACEAVCRAIATVEDCSALKLAPIGEVIDPDSLDALFSPTNSAERYHLRLRYAGYEIALHSDEITVLSVA